MNKRERITTFLLYGVFLCYVLLLLKILFLSRVSISQLMNGQRGIIRSINLVPFQSIMQFISGSAEVKKFAFGNVIGNIVLFVPLGVYLPVFKKDKRILPSLLLVFLMSLLTEAIQGYFGIGAADIDDIILNCLGGLIGILIYKVFYLIIRDQKKVRSAIAILSAVVGLPVLFYFMFIIKMRF